MRLRLLFTLVCAAALAGSCVREEAWRTSDEGTVQFSIAVPQLDQVESRALTADQESAVTHVDVLIFDTDDKFYAWSEATSKGSYTYQVKLPSAACNVMIVANAGTVVGSASAFVQGSTTWTQAQTMLTQTMTTKWPSNVGIPMFGYARGVSSANAFNVDMHRMLAKIDVAVSSAASANFVLKSVALCNYNTNGYVSPNLSAAYWDEDGGTASNGQAVGIALKPSIPAAPGKVSGWADRQEWAATNATSLTNEIYTFESAKATAANVGNTCLVVGGSYKGGQTTYYRVDMKSGAAWWDLLRNHRYLLTVSDVAGAGYLNPEEAYNNYEGMGNITTSLVKWEQGAQGIFSFDGRNFLKVSATRSLNFDGQSAFNGNALKINTTYNTGWTARITSDAEGKNEMTSPWLTLDKYSGAAGTEATVNLIMAVNTGPARTAYVHVTAGDLSGTTRAVQEIALYKVKAFNSANGSVTINTAAAISPGIAKDATAQVTASPAVGYYFAGWSVSGGATYNSGSSAFTNPATIKMSDKDVEVFAEFKKKTYTGDMAKGAATGNPTGGTLAPPGVVGVTAGGVLTLRGSKEYTSLASYALQFGGLSGETVYTAIFKWGSLVAFSGVSGDTWSGTGDVIWAPSGFDFAAKITADWASVPMASGDYWPVTQDYAGGIGDVCKLFGARMPEGNPWNSTNYTTASFPTATVNGVAGRKDNFLNPDFFFPYAGYRNASTGEVFNVGAYGYYWSRMPTGASNAYALSFDSTGVNPSSNGNRSNGFAVRCLPE